MPTRKKAEQEKESGGSEVLQEAAKAIGSALGTMARKTGIAGAKPPKASGKLVKKLKKRLPRKQKKEAKKRAAKT